jgi:hypothetical protein
MGLVAEVNLVPAHDAPGVSVKTVIRERDVLDAVERYVGHVALQRVTTIVVPPGGCVTVLALPRKVAVLVVVMASS